MSQSSGLGTETTYRNIFKNATFMGLDAMDLAAFGGVFALMLAFTDIIPGFSPIHAVTLGMLWLGFLMFIKRGKPNGYILYAIVHLFSKKTFMPARTDVPVHTLIQTVSPEKLRENMHSHIQNTLAFGDVSHRNGR